MLLIGYLFDIRSERKLIEEISLNLAYRWYIDYDLDEQIPDHSIFSKARTRFGKKLFLNIFEEILKKCIDFGLVGKRRRDENRTSLREKSTTEPDATLFYRPGQGSYLSYKAHFSTDTSGFVTAVMASPSKKHFYTFL